MYWTNLSRKADITFSYRAKSSAHMSFSVVALISTGRDWLMGPCIKVMDTLICLLWPIFLHTRFSRENISITVIPGSLIHPAQIRPASVLYKCGQNVINSMMEKMMEINPLSPRTICPGTPFHLSPCSCPSMSINCFWTNSPSLLPI